MVADGTDFDNVAVSGDATLANTGALTIANDAVTTAKILNSNVTLAKIVSASATNKLLGRLSSGGGVFEEVSVETTLSSTDEAIPTSKAVRDDIVSLLNDVGGFVAVATEVAFPNTNPDPDDGAGTVVSIANVGGLVVDGSGVSTTGRTLGGATVTINSISSTYYSSTIADGLGMQVVSTAVLNTYSYHKIIAKEGDTNIVATNIANVNLTGGNSANITTVAGQISPTNNIATLAANNSNITNVGGSIANVNIVAGASADIETCADNLTGISNFAARYRVDSSDPSSSLDEGDLAYTSTANVLKYYNGSAWVTIVAGSLTDIVQDGSPQLGADLDLNSYSIDFPTTPNISDCLDEDNMASNSATKIATQQSIKAYVDASATSPEVYGFNVNASGRLIVTTTNSGADDITSATYATFQDTLLSVAGYTWSLVGTQLRCTI
jgi:hypothetical protein